MAVSQSQPNRKVGSIEHVGKDGFIVEAADPSDPDFYGGKRLFKDFDTLLRFLADHLQVYKEKGSSYGLRPSGMEGFSPHEIEQMRKQRDQELAGDNGAGKPLHPVEEAQAEAT